jgi:hypothetical protein
LGVLKSRGLTEMAEKLQKVIGVRGRKDPIASKSESKWSSILDVQAAFSEQARTLKNRAIHAHVSCYAKISP